MNQQKNHPKGSAPAMHVSKQTSDSGCIGHGLDAFMRKLRDWHVISDHVYTGYDLYQYAADCKTPKKGPKAYAFRQNVGYMFIVKSFNS